MAQLLKNWKIETPDKNKNIKNIKKKQYKKEKRKKGKEKEKMSAFPTTNLEPMFLGGGNGHGGHGHGHTGGVFVPGRVKAAFATTKGSDQQQQQQHHQQHQDQQPAAQKKSDPPANTMENFPSLSMAAAVAVNKKKWRTSEESENSKKYIY